jgi:site-specific DNA recombinase
VAREREDAEKLARSRGWTIVATHSDNDTSAAGSKKRPGFDATMRAVENGDADAVIAWALDRLTRNRRDTLRLVETCEKA